MLGKPISRFSTATPHRLAASIVLTLPPSASGTPNLPPQPTNTIALQPTNTIPPPTATQEPAPAPAQVVISYIYFDGQVPQVESAESAVITNQGGSAVNLQGWRLSADDAGQDFVFPSYELQPGASCRVYTNENHPEYCGFSFGGGQALWANRGVWAFV